MKTTKKSSTKRSLALSTLSLVLCIAMLLGTTYAWFTDSVTSGKNTIIAGNLDVELYHAQGTVTDSSEKVGGVTNLFHVDGWEPGVIAYENFMVKNIGNLALKYQLTLSVSAFNETVVGGYNLKQVLKVAVIPGGFSGNRAEAQALTDYTTLEAFSTNSNGALLPSAADVFGVVIYWEPGENDNNWNLSNGKKATVVDGKFTEDALGIELGINLFATQLPHEYDSFDNQYDASADGSDRWTGSALASAVAGKPTVFTVDVVPAVDDNNTVVEFPAGALKEGSYKLDVDTENILFEARSENGEAASVDLKLYDKDGKLTETFESGKTATITTYVTKGMSGVTVKYIGTDGKAQPTFKSYDPTTGKLVFETNHFSEYQVVTSSVAYIKEADKAYDQLTDTLNAVKADQTVTLLQNTETSGQPKVDVAGNFTFDLNKKTLTLHDRLTINGSAKMTMINGTVISDETTLPALISFTSGMGAAFTDMTFKGTGTGDYAKGAVSLFATNEEITNTFAFQNCKFENAYVTYGNSADTQNCPYDLSFKNCDFNCKFQSGKSGISCIYVDTKSSGSLLAENCKFTMESTYTSSYGIDAKDYSHTPFTVTLKNITFNGIGSGVAICRNPGGKLSVIEEGTNTYMNNGVVVPKDGIVATGKGSGAINIKTFTDVKSGYNWVVTLKFDGYTENFALPYDCTFIVPSGMTYNGTVTGKDCAVDMSTNENGDTVYKAYRYTVGDQKFAKSADAVKAAKDGKTKQIVLACDVNDTITLTDSALTFNTNGHTWTGTVKYSGNYVAKLENGIYSAAPAVAKANNTNYATLAEAVTKATYSNSIITLLADCSEDVELDPSISFRLRIDTNGKNYTGTVTVKDNAYPIAKVGNYIGIANAKLTVGDTVTYYPYNMVGSNPNTTGSALYDAKNANADCTLELLVADSLNPWAWGPSGHTLTVKTLGDKVYKMSGDTEHNLVTVTENSEYKFEPIQN